jgi:membrane-bound metal-dependent hydrolase YbcI (DUF457 family)
VRRLGRRAGCFWGIVTFAVGSVFWLIGEVVSRIVEGLAWLIQQVTTHRGLTHSLIVAIYVVIASLSLSVFVTPTRTPWWGVAWSVGWLTHLGADALTFSGLKLLQPWSERRYWLAPRGLRFRVGTWPDMLLGALAPIMGLMVLLLVHGLFAMLALAG